jgi:3-(3-hydroxy-phenyl)propionate hydroxylase
VNGQRPRAGVHPVTAGPVIIAGAGPAGCTSALLLADAGVPVILLERHLAPHPLPRAVHLDDEVTRTLHKIGVSGRFLAMSRPGSGLRLLDARHRVMAEFRRDLSIGRHGFPQANMFHQPDLEELLFARVGQHPLIDFRRGAEVTGLTGALDPFTAPPVRVTARLAGGGTETVTGCLVLGCDGANSTIRGLAGITMDDLGFTQRWLVVDIRTPAGLQTWDGVEQVCDPARAATFMQVTGERYRWEFQLRDGEDEADLSTPGALGSLLRPWTGRASLDGLEIIRSATYTFRAQLASRFRAGRVFLLGDAAHLTPPFIGQGLAAGLRDCDNLAWKIAHVRGGRAAESLLDSYEAERRPHARALVRKAMLVGWAMTGGQDRAAVVRRVALAAACRSASFRLRMADPATPRLRTGALQPVTRFHRGTGGLAVGALLPNPLVTTSDGSRLRLDDLLRGRTAILTAREPGPELTGLCRHQDLLLIRLQASPPAADAATGPGSGGDARCWTGASLAEAPPCGLDTLIAKPGLSVVVRPDRVIAAIAAAGALPRLPWHARVPGPAGVRDGAAAGG